MAAGKPREFLLDVSRLVWRLWRGGLPTGIDRVCLAYVEHFGSRSRAVLQRGGYHFVLSPTRSDRLFKALVSRKPERLKLIRLLVTAVPTTLMRKPRPGSIYLNVGHTGLNEASLPAWIDRHRLRAVYMVHDLIPLTHPQFCRAGEAEKHRSRMRNVLASAAGIIGNSQATLDDLVAFANAEGLTPPARIAAWISGDRGYFKSQPRTLDRPHFITVGTIEGRKNHELLLKIWRRLVADLSEEAPILLIIGQRGWQAERVFEQLDHLRELDGYVRELGACDDEELAGWIAGARALLMPSFAEGFGLPVVETLLVGTPVIASDLPVFREIAADIPAYLDPSDIDAWERRIRAFMRDAPERTRQLTKVEHYRVPGWKEHFATVEPWLRSI